MPRKQQLCNICCEYLQCRIRYKKPEDEIMIEKHVILKSNTKIIETVVDRSVHNLNNIIHNMMLIYKLVTFELEV
jgi:hypothetical protein